MATTDNPLLGNGSISQNIRGVGATLTAPATNSALQLAASLKDLEPTVTDALDTYEGQQKLRLSTQAHQDALQNNGQVLADAVQQGKILPTQNPFYVQAYERESAAVRSQQDFAQLQTASTTWAEQSDPVAFQKRWAEESGNILQNYQGRFAEEGVAPVANQFTQQALEANTQQNVHRITTERDQNAQALLASDITNLATSQGGRATPNQVGSIVAAAKQMYVGTGGSEADFNGKLVPQAVIDAGRQTKNAGLFEILKAPELLHGPSADGDHFYGDGAVMAPPPADPAAVPAAGIPQAAPAATVAQLWPHLVSAESRGNQGAVSPKGARSLAQLMPGTASLWAQQLGQPQLASLAMQNTPEGAQAATTLGQHGLGTLLARFGGNPVAALAAYNAGPNHPWLGSSLTPDQIPFPETKAYVNKILGSAGVAAGGGAVTPLVPVPSAARMGAPMAPARGPSLYDFPGVADDVDNASYRIQRATEFEATAAQRAQQMQLQQRGMQGKDSLFQTFGNKLLTGAVPTGDLVNTLTQGGYKPQEIAAVLDQVATTTAGIAKLDENRIKLNGSNPETATRNLALATEAVTSGNSADYITRVTAAMLNGDITSNEARSYVDSAQSRSNALQTQGDETARRAAEAHMKAVSEGLAQTQDLSSAYVQGLAQVRRNPVMASDPKVNAEAKQLGATAYRAYLAAHPNDPGGALQAARLSLAQWARRKATTSGPLTAAVPVGNAPSSNPMGTN